MSLMSARLAALRAELAAQKLDGFVIPLTDEHQSEYVPDYAQRLAYITGFTGSAGSAVVMMEKAAVFADGRYTVQARAQLDETLFELRHVPEDSPAHYLRAETRKGQRIGFDPFLHTEGWVREARAACAANGAELVAVANNPVDAVWTDQPAEPVTPVMIHDPRFAGKTPEEKRADVAHILKEAKADAAILTQLDSIAWAFNIRAQDVKHTPVSLAFAILFADGTAELYMHPGKHTDALRAHLGNTVALQPKADFLEGCKRLGALKKSVLIDPATASAALFEALESAGASLIRKPDPTALLKACKNAVEIEGMKRAHVRDGVVEATFLHWLETEAANGGLDEMTAAARLDSLRKGAELCHDLSFRSISAANANAALPHYSVTKESNRPIEPGIYLIDSGGQYEDGTTDITRTVAIGTPTPEMRDRFTRVLKGHIALATAVFPEGTTGPQLDSFARRPLWEAGLDYDHGTGHGVGCFLAVHEGPQRIAKVQNSIALRPGMVVSNEPGYYKAGEYGIRIENLELVVEAPAMPDHERKMLKFEALTRAPIDRRLIDLDLLTDRELDWLNDYHAKVWTDIGPLLDGETKNWLKERTAPARRN